MIDGRHLLFRVPSWASGEVTGEAADPSCAGWTGINQREGTPIAGLGRYDPPPYHQRQHVRSAIIQCLGLPATDVHTSTYTLNTLNTRIPNHRNIKHLPPGIHKIKHNGTAHPLTDALPLGTPLPLPLDARDLHPVDRLDGR